MDARGHDESDDCLKFIQSTVATISYEVHMTMYHAPLQDMRFILEQLADVASISRFPGCDNASSDIVAAILEEAGKFAAGVLAPLNLVGDAQGCRFDQGKVVTAVGAAVAGYC